jgi:gliding motility-associated-like protein
VEVVVNPLPPIIAMDDQWLYAGGCTRLMATGGDIYTWSPPTFLGDPTAQEPISCPTDTITYYVTGIDANGCVNIDSVMIYAVGIPEPNIPTAFTPDGNGLNDVFRLESPEYFTMQSFTVFNRWGEVVFETTDPLSGWDGTFMGQPQPIGTYVYRVIGVDDIGYRVARQGNVTLLR